MEKEFLAGMAKVFEEKFGTQAERRYFSPGRVNLIGEHTDYNGGHVFPCAISLGTYALVRDRADAMTRVYSMNLADKGVIEFSMSGLVYDAAKDWANYFMGVVDVFEKAGYKASHGFDIVINGTLPGGAGLSSSASLEVLMSVILNEAFSFGLPMLEMVKLSQRAENKFVGVNCGIMDQFAVGMGKADCAMLLDCNTLDYRYSKIDLQDASIVITNTNKPHSLASSAYNVRRAQCEHALNELREVRPELKALGELSNEAFERIAGHIAEQLERQRAHHAVFENNRTLEAVAALERDDVARFGNLMNESHFSLRDDYDVTGRELDTLAEIAWSLPGVIGSRMTGAGFGGSTVSLVKNDAIETFRERVSAVYTERIGYAPSFYVASIAEGTHRLD
ncbi:galactokinase [Selenomonas bovis]|uniref:galactokinase n=1 Tax=Selenomonas bovis TaxID=416586 RepID=UPI003AB9A0B0